jgi:hypothetical protein
LKSESIFTQSPRIMIPCEMKESWRPMCDIPRPKLNVIYASPLSPRKVR